MCIFVFEIKFKLAIAFSIVPSENNRVYKIENDKIGRDNISHPIKKDNEGRVLTHVPLPFSKVGAAPPISNIAVSAI